MSLIKTRQRRTGPSGPRATRLMGEWLTSLWIRSEPLAPSSRKPPTTPARNFAYGDSLSFGDWPPAAGNEVLLRCHPGGLRTLSAIDILPSTLMGPQPFSTQDAPEAVRTTSALCMGSIHAGSYPFSWAVSSPWCLSAPTHHMPGRRPG
jgi:hypothetical protein